MKMMTEKEYKDRYGFDLSLLNDFNWVKDRLFLKLVNPATYPSEKLEAVALKPVADLALQVNIEIEGVGKSGTVGNALLELWGITFNEAIQIALRNEKEKYEIQTMNLGDVALVVRNNKEVNGATAIFDKKLQKKLEQIEGGYYILPSSIHELICISKIGHTVSELKKIVRGVNEKEVSIEDYLSDNVYELVDGELRIAVEA